MPNAGRTRSLSLYLLPIVAGPLLLFVAAFFIIPTTWFIQHSGNTYLENLAYATKLQHVNCPVVIWGDSTAMVGVDPAVIKARTGLTACNIAEFKGMALVTQTLLLDEYLEHNVRPHYLVILFAPEAMFMNTDWSKTPTFEAITYLVQTQPKKKVFRKLALHPVDTLGWAGLGLRMTLTRLYSHPASFTTMHQRELHNGQLPVTGPPEVSCEKIPRNGVPDPKWLQSLRRRYSIGGTKVFIDATPTPSCDPGLPANLRVLPSLIDNNPYPTFPYDFYIKGDRLHVNARGATLLSNMVADQILTQMRSEARGAPRR